MNPNDSHATYFMLSSALESIEDAVFIKDTNGTYLMINSVGAAMTGKKVVEILGNDDRRLFSPAIAQKIIADDRLIMDTGVSQLVEESETVNGVEIFFSTLKSPLRNNEGKIVGMVGVARNVTQSRAAEKSLRESEARFRTLFELAPFSVQIFAVDGHTLQVNAAWKQLWDMQSPEAEAFVLQKYNVLQDPQLVQQGVSQDIARAFAGQVVHLPPHFYDAGTHGVGGRGRWLQSTFHPIKNARNQVTEVVLIQDDVTIRVRVEAERNAHEQELRKAISARDQFLSIASHELKTPLTSLQLQTQILKRSLTAQIPDAAQWKKFRAAIDRNEQQVRHLSALIDNMLDIGQLNSSKLSLKTEDFDLIKLMREVIERLHPQILLSQSAFEFKIPPGVSDVNGRWDRFRLQQVLVNLISNATKYGRGQPIDVELTLNDDRVEIKVRDGGDGIAPENFLRIFECFERAGDEKHISGLGLGLYISRSIVEMHGGKIWVESVLGKGSTFYVSLPLRRS